MNNKTITTGLLSLLAPLIAFNSPASALGELTVERKSGETQVFSDVEISDTKDIIYFQGGDNNNILMITKNECDKEGELLVCKKARVGLQSYGILEELNVDQIFVFINSSGEKQSIKGSTVTMSPKTVLLEFLTSEGNFVTGFGRIDSDVSPEGALK